LQLFRHALRDPRPMPLRGEWSAHLHELPSLHQGANTKVMPCCDQPSSADLLFPRASAKSVSHGGLKAPLAEVARWQCGHAEIGWHETCFDDVQHAVKS